MNEWLATLVPALATALLHFLWQGALIGLLAWLALALLRNARPQARYAVACLALLACVALPAVHVMDALVQRSGPTVSAAAPASPQGAEAASTLATQLLPVPSTHWLPWVVALWASGAALLALRMACGLFWVQRLRRTAVLPGDGALQACADRLAERLRIRRAVAVRLVGAGDSPVSAGWWRPVVLLPVAIAARMPAGLLEALIAHELAHVRRHDYLVNLLQGMVETLLFYHPVVWWLSHRIRIERELVADDLAAAALGERRRLALALSELDRLVSDGTGAARSPHPTLHFAQAAHGGHLMSRIQQLVRPDRRAVGGALLLPLAGVLIAGTVFYAQARIVGTPTPSAQADSAAKTAPLPEPRAAASSMLQARPAAATEATPRQLRLVTARDGDSGSSYALVREGREGFSMSGDLDDVDAIRAAQRRIDGDFIWFRRDGQAYVLRDAGTIARAREAWRPTEALDAQMRALDARMKPHSEALERLGERMEALSDDTHTETPQMREASANMEALGERMGDLGERQAALAQRLTSADDAERARLERDMQALDAQQEALGREMERHGAALEAASGRMRAQQQPMEALGRQMEDASRPMETIGKDMEALGERIERQANLADGQIRALIDDAYERGLAEPASTRQ